MDDRENYLLTVVEHQKTGHIPRRTSRVNVDCGGAYEEFENGPECGGFDGFGVKWEPTQSTGGALVPLSEPIVLTDITRWKEQVTFPDVDAVDWKGMAELQLAGVDRSRTVVEYSAYNAQFLRVTHLMGFMKGLCAFVEEPEACEELLDAITDYKIRCAERIAEYFRPDFYTAYDDVATQSSLFLSPSVYRRLIKPQHKRVNDAVRAMGMYPVIHTCGKCEALIQDFIDEGAVAWTSAQPVNDIAGILREYGNRISVMGGYDSNGRPGTLDASDEEVEAEVRRCLREYGGYGSYVFAGFRMGTDWDSYDVGMASIDRALDKCLAEMGQ